MRLQGAKAAYPCPLSGLENAAYCSYFCGEMPPQLKKEQGSVHFLRCTRSKALQA